MDISIETVESRRYFETFRSADYHILLANTPICYQIDGVNYVTTSKSLVFIAPYQRFRVLERSILPLFQLVFSGDYYCIEFHKYEVACNGLLFNSVYQLPHVEITDNIYTEIEYIYLKIRKKKDEDTKFTHSIIKSYLQLLLSLSADEKQKFIDDNSFYTQLTNEKGIVFQDLVEKFYKVEKSTNFYASRMHMSPSAFSRKIKRSLHRSPSKIIQERTILEAKKLLHLTYKPIKEIAHELCFEDQHHFSRYFKNNVGVSPTQYRKQVGISIVANLSKE